MSFGVVMMCHTYLHRAAQVARFWADGGVPVVIHIDRHVTDSAAQRLTRQLSEYEHVSFTRSRFHCEWGTWAMVQAAQAGASQMLERHPEVGHVLLSSGTCLPLRPISHLQAYLAARPETDFIESVTTVDVGWATGGLNLERFTLRFPFSWKRQPRLFDAYVNLQRRLGFSRNVPVGVEPHLGSQWWCLTRKTLTAILESPHRARHDRYFKHVWIPDESYFQSLARNHSTHIESRSLTLAKFDVAGKPHILYDDHLQLLRRSDCFVARKAWHGAHRLYATFLSPQPDRDPLAEPNPSKLDRLFEKAVERRTRGRAGLYMQSRFPLRDRENGKTSAPYSVFQGFTDIFESFESWLTKAAGCRVHGHIFGPERVEFAGGEHGFTGGLSDSALLRDYDPRAFLTSLIWSSRGERQCFQFSPRDNQSCNWFMATDPNAQITVVSGAWAVPLFRLGLPAQAVRKEAAQLQKIETDQLSILRSVYVKARVRIIPLADFLENPMELLQAVIDEINPRSQRRLTEVPRLVDLSQFGRFLQDLRNQGMQPTLMGEFAPGPVAPTETAPVRPYAVR